MTSTPSSSRAEAWRGLVVALALGLLVLLVFYVFAFSRAWHFPKPSATRTAPAPQRPEGSSARAPKDEDDLVSPRPPGTASAGSPALAPTTSASAALRELLHAYRADPNSTASASISSSGKVTLKPGGPLTGMDGLPVDALRKGSMVSGAPAGR